MRVKYLKMISYLSFIFIIANFILCINNLQCINGYAFLWIILIMALVCSDVQINKVLRAICALAMFIPIFFSHGISYKISVVIIGVVLISFRKRFTAEINYDQVLYQLKTAFALSIIMIFFSFLAADSEIVNNYIIPYVILFLIFDIMLLRIMRNYKYNVVNKRIRRINTIYMLIIAAFSAILSIKEVRNIFSAGANYIYKGISYVLTKAALFLSYCFFKVFPGFTINQKTVDKFFETFSKVYGKNDNRQDLSEGLRRVQPMFTVQSIIVKAIIIVIVAVIIIHLFKMQYNKKKKTEDFVETRESIRNNTHGERKRQNIYDKLKKGSYKDKIRYYYYRFLKDCSKKNINIVDSDTTKEINNKAESSFDRKCLINMRGIYLKAKYTDYECTTEDFEGFHKNYKEK